MAGEVVNGEMASGDWTIGDHVDSLSSYGFAEDDRGRSISSYRDLDVWKEGMALPSEIYRCTASFPREELYGLTSQMRRACVSIPANIAEGYGREKTGSFIQFLRISQGSLKELETLIEISSDLTFLATDLSESLQIKTDRLGKMIRGLIRALERRNAS